uniref:Uncharacterized protein n=1 Tax=viral metagenome TaxID=1070528 RepID=A0A6M3KYX7_9ZZZZ
MELVDFEANKERAMIYKDEAKELLKKVLSRAGYKLVGEWKESQMFDYRIPGGHIEFVVKLSGWGQSTEDKEAGA